MTTSLDHIPKDHAARVARALDSRKRWRWAVERLNEWLASTARPRLGLRRWVTRVRWLRFAQGIESWADLGITPDIDWNVVAINNTCVTFHLAKAGVYFKVHRTKTWRHALKATFRHGLFGPSKTTIETRALHRMAVAGIPVPQPVAWGDTRWWGWLTGSFIATRAIRDCESLDTWLDSEEAEDEICRRQFANQLADAVARLHQAGMFHGRLTFRNILVCRQDNQIQPAIIDTDKAGRLWPLVLRRSATWDLANLDAGCQGRVRRTERLRFFKRYRDVKRLSSADKQVIRRIIVHSRQLAEQERNRLAVARYFDPSLYGRIPPEPIEPSDSHQVQS